MGMLSVSSALHRAVQAAGIPITGVSIGAQNDRTTWRIEYNGASNAQKIAGAALIQSFDLADSSVVAREADAAAKDLDDRKLQALAVAVHKRFKQFVPADTMTVSQWKKSLRDEFDALG
jgi:hypothetical protein